MLPGEARRPGRSAVIALRPLTLVFAAALTLAVGACGDEGDDDAGGDAGAQTELTVTLDPDGPDGEQSEMSEEVSCGDTDEDAACSAVGELEFSALAPTPPDMACTELYGGPDTATIEGVIALQEIDVELTRSNGCEIARFDAAVPLLEALFPDYEPGASLRP